ncbi:MAG TPA: hypothetical protein VN442_18490 [Bryobacteraceae bacterium]|nr:hypothetical protein [Bryobacteraceae bacterium]
MCAKCVHWRRALSDASAELNRRVGGHPKEWGVCEFEHSRMYVNLPEEAGSGRASLLTAGTFSCAELVRVRHA